MLNRLRHRHAKGELWVGVNVQQETLCDNMVACVWEPAIVKRQVEGTSYVQFNHCILCSGDHGSG
jgi:T-complex protein 1 subunit eta